MIMDSLQSHGVQYGLQAQLVMAAIAIAIAVLSPAGVRSRVTGAAGVLLGLLGAITGVIACAVEPGSAGWVRLPMALPAGLPLDDPALAPDHLGGVFLVVAGLVGALSALFGIGYVHGAAGSRTGWSAFVVFLLGMQLVPAAADTISFLLAWELMAVGSTVLLLADHSKREQVRTAAVWYAVMTHLSFVLLVAGFAVMSAAAGGTSFAHLASDRPTGTQASVAFLLLALGFATKAGLVPLHVWLPRAHPEAPSHMSAAMSAAMVKMGVYGIMLVALRLLPGGPRWWAVLVLSLGALSAVYGILQASVASDLKRLLAYSTTENVGLMVTAVGVGMLLRVSGLPEVADVAMVAALLLMVSHAAFKTVLFLGAGSVLHATGERDVDRLGGLGQRMPVTAATFLAAALGAAALPVSSGFVAEWVLLQALIHGPGPQDQLVAVLLPVTVAIVALTAGLALLTFVKAYGVAFLARPRSSGAAEAREGGPAMRAALLLGAFAVIGLGVVPGPLTRVLAEAVGADRVTSIGVWGVDLPDVQALLHPLAVLGLAAALGVPVALVTLVAARRSPRRSVELAWGCGGVRVSPRMQYTATSYAEPLVRVFEETLRPHRDVTITHAKESHYLEQRVVFRQRLSDVVEDRAYAPAAAVLLKFGIVARRLQNGSIHRYLFFSFVTVIVLLVVVSR